MENEPKIKNIYQILKKDKTNKYVALSIWRRQDLGHAVKLEMFNVPIEKLNRIDVEKSIKTKFGAGVFIAKRYEGGALAGQDEFFNIEKEPENNKKFPFPEEPASSVNLEMYYKMQERIEEIKKERDIEIQRLKNENTKFQSDMQLNAIRISREELKLKILSERWQDERELSKQGQLENSDIFTKIISYVTDPKNSFFKEFITDIQKSFFSHSPPPKNPQPIPPRPSIWKKKRKREPKKK